MKALGWFDIDVNEMERAERFHKAVLHADLEDMADPQIYFSDEDCATQQARIEAAGGQVLRPKFPIGAFGFVTLARDTEGNMIGFNSLK